MKQQTITVSGRGRKEKENSAYNSTKCIMQNFSNYKGLSTINPESERTNSHSQTELSSREFNSNYPISQTSAMITYNSNYFNFLISEGKSSKRKIKNKIFTIKCGIFS